MKGTALVVIDAQNEYFAPTGKWVLPAAEEALQQIHLLLAAARNAGVPVFHIVHERLESFPPVFQHGSVGAEIHPSIDVLPGEQKVLKHFPGSFTQTPLEAELRHAQIDTLVICGYQTQLCCDTTTRQARERGFGVWFVSDATAACDQQIGGQVIAHDVIHESTLGVVGTSFGAQVMSTAEVIARWA